MFVKQCETILYHSYFVQSLIKCTILPENNFSDFTIHSRRRLVPSTGIINSNPLSIKICIIWRANRRRGILPGRSEKASELSHQNKCLNMNHLPISIQYTEFIYRSLHFAPSRPSVSNKLHYSTRVIKIAVDCIFTSVNSSNSLTDWTKSNKKNPPLHSTTSSEPCRFSWQRVSAAPAISSRDPCCP